MADSRLEKTILEILAANWPLRTREIAEALRQRGLQISYGTVHKQLGKLVVEGVLKREERGYMLSLQWISQMRAFAERIQESYHGRPTIDDVDRIDSSAEYWFGNVQELDRFFVALTEAQEKRLTKDVSICWYYKHNWWPLFYSQAEHGISAGAEGRNKRFYFICGSDTPVDRWCCDVERKMGFNVLHAKPIAGCDMVIFGDLIFQIYLPEEFIADLEKLYRSPSVEKLDMDVLLSLIKHPRRIRVLALRNAELARSLRQGIMKHFT